MSKQSVFKMNVPSFTIDQQKALETLIKWFKAENKPMYVTLGGFAGTGKTTLIASYRKEIHKIDKKTKVAFCTYTGKGTLVLKEKLHTQDAIYKQDFTGTIHSLIYSPVTNQNQEIIGWKIKDELKFDLIIIDEASMVDSKIWADLCAFNIPILAVGDHGQLPPINGQFNLMEKPMLKLEHIHRQAQDNPIINISIMARTNGEIPHGKYAESIIKHSSQDSDINYLIEDVFEKYDENTIILCGYNNTRIKINNHIRNQLFFETPEPDINDKLICLRNNHEKQIFNGMLGKVESIHSEDENWYFAEINMESTDTIFKGLIYKNQFNALEPINFTKNRKETLKGELFDFGYAITVHKAQGSESDKVILFEERFKQMDDETWKKWLYTAVTRAKKELYIIG